MAAKFKVSEVVAAIAEARGFVSVAAKKLGCDRVTVYNYIDRHPTVKEALVDAREATKDIAELKLLNRINEGSDTAIIFYLKTQAKDRGYIEKINVSNESLDLDKVPWDSMSIDQLDRIQRGEPVSDILKEMAVERQSRD